MHRQRQFPRQGLPNAVAMLSLIAGVALAGCAGTAPPASDQANASPPPAVAEAPPPAVAEAPPPTAEATPPAPPAPPAPAALVYLDADVFDAQLSKAMGSQAPVTVKTLDGVSLNEMPKRLNTWLSAVQDRGGDVTVVTAEGVNPATGQTRGLEGIAIGAVQYLVEAVYNKYHEAQMYGPAQNYNATLVITPGTSKLQEIRFTRKES